MRLSGPNTSPEEGKVRRLQRSHAFHNEPFATCEDLRSALFYLHEPLIILHASSIEAALDDLLAKR